MGLGIFASGLFMRKFKPNPRFGERARAADVKTSVIAYVLLCDLYTVASWIALAALLYAFGMVILMFLGCPLNNVVGLNAGE